MRRRVAGGGKDKRVAEQQVREMQSQERENTEVSDEREEVGRETGEVTGKGGVTGDTLGEMAGELVKGVGEIGVEREVSKVLSEMGEENKRAGGLEEVGEPGEVNEAGEAVGEMGEVGKVAGKLYEIFEVTGDKREADKERETGEVTGETIKIVGEQDEGGAVAGAEEMEASEAGWESAPLKRRSKRRNTLTVEVGGKAGRLIGKLSAAGKRAAITADISDSSDSEGCVSDCSDLSHTQQAAAQVYPAEKLKAFLLQTKGMKNLKLELHFPDMQGFYNSARHIIKHRAESDLTDQEVFRLKKQMIKVRKQLAF